jgi:RIO kinase 1
MTKRSFFEPSPQVTLEKQWILENLNSFYHDNIIKDVLYRVKGGKEANVYCCAAHPSTGLDLLAAKIYRPQTHRTMRNDWLYRQGRETIDASGKAIRDGRSIRAIQKRTRYGRGLLRGSWIGHEYATLETLHQAGADVPKPVDIRGSTILMEYLGDESAAAPVLHGIALRHGEACELFKRAMANVECMLRSGVIHGDLSAYNVMYWQGRIWLIDFPQAVDPVVNPNAFLLLARDVDRLCRYFARFAVRADAGVITADMWSHFVAGSC